MTRAPSDKPRDSPHDAGKEKGMSTTWTDEERRCFTALSRYP